MIEISRCHNCAAFTPLRKRPGFRREGHCGVHLHHVNPHDSCGQFERKAEMLDVKPPRRNARQLPLL